MPTHMPLPELLIQHGTFIMNPPPAATSVGAAKAAEGSRRSPKAAKGAAGRGAAAQGRPAGPQGGGQVDEGALEQFVDAAVRQPCAHKLLGLLWRWAGRGWVVACNIFVKPRVHSDTAM